MSNKRRVFDFLLGSIIGYMMILFAIWFTKLVMNITFKGLIVI